MFYPLIIAQKTVSYAINSHVLTEHYPSINRAIHVVLIHGYETLRVRFRRHIKDALLPTLFCDVTSTFVYALKAALSKRRLVTRASARSGYKGK